MPAAAEPSSELRTTRPRRAFEIIISDKGPGIADLDAVLSGSQPSEKGMGVGLRGARRLMDAFHVESTSRPWHNGARCQVTCRRERRR